MSVYCIQSRYFKKPKIKTMQNYKTIEEIEKEIDRDHMELDYDRKLAIRVGVFKTYYDLIRSEAMKKNAIISELEKEIEQLNKDIKLLNSKGFDE